MEEIDEILDENGINKGNMEAALELAKLVAEDTGLCCDELGKFAWACYQQLEAEDE